MSVLEIARDYFPDADDEMLEAIIWEETGFPGFWRIPEDGPTPELCFRHQLKIARDHFDCIKSKYIKSKETTDE